MCCHRCSRPPRRWRWYSKCSQLLLRNPTGLCWPSTRGRVRAPCQAIGILLPHRRLARQIAAWCTRSSTASRRILTRNWCIGRGHPWCTPSSIGFFACYVASLLWKPLAAPRRCLSPTDNLAWLLASSAFKFGRGPLWASFEPFLTNYKSICEVCSSVTGRSDCSSWRSPLVYWHSFHRIDCLRAGSIHLPPGTHRLVAG